MYTMCLELNLPEAEFWQYLWVHKWENPFGPLLQMFESTPPVVCTSSGRGGRCCWHRSFRDSCHSGHFYHSRRVELKMRCDHRTSVFYMKCHVINQDICVVDNIKHEGGIAQTLLAQKLNFEQVCTKMSKISQTRG